MLEILLLRLFPMLFGLVTSLYFVWAWDKLWARLRPSYKPTSWVLRVLTICGFDGFMAAGIKGAAVVGALTVGLWPVVVGLYCLVRYRPHWYTIWSAAKAVFAVAISPIILLVYLVDSELYCKSLFIAIMSALWPHLDIYTPQGELYLRRWFMTPKGQSYHPRFLHLILMDDDGRDPHDHPGAFSTRILMNGYDEEIFFPKQDRDAEMRLVRAGKTYENPDGHTHRVKLIGPTLSWVVAWKRSHSWGFWKMGEDPSEDEWVESNAYGEKGEERKSWTIDGR